MKTPMKTNPMRSVKEIATLYYADVLPVVASRNLRRDIRDYAELHQSLLDNGWHERKRNFTPKQVELLIHYLGNPL